MPEFNSTQIQNTVEEKLLVTLKNNICHDLHTFIMDKYYDTAPGAYMRLDVFCIHMWYSKGVEIVHGTGKATKQTPMEHYHFTLPLEHEPEFLKLKEQEKTLLIQKDKVKSFLRYLISPCETISDLYAVFPSSLQDFLPSKDNSEISLVPEQISSLQQYANNNPILQTIQFRNFLLK